MNKIKAILGHQGLKRYFFNTSWVFATYGIRILAGFFVGLWVARYLGPSDFGIYNYVISFIAIFSAFSSFGTNEQLVTDLVRRPEETRLILTAAFYLRVFLGFLSFIVIYFITVLSPKPDSDLYLYVAAPVIVLQTFDLIDVYYRATVNAKTSSFVRIVQILASSALKIYFIQTRAPLIYFFYVFTFDYASYGILIYYSYSRLSEGFILHKPDRHELTRIIFTCWPLMLMVVSSNLLTKLDQVLIGNYLTKTDLGYYSASGRILELAGTVSVLAFASLYSAIVNAKKTSEEEFTKRIFHLSLFLRWFSVFFAIGIYFYSEEVIVLLFGSSFLFAANILRIHCFNFLFFTMSIVSMHWYIAQGLNKLLMIKTIFAGIFNIIVNIILIPRFGVFGAVYASLGTYIIFYSFYDFFNPKTRACFYINNDIGFALFKKKS